MDSARKELGRLMAYNNPHAWSVPDSVGINHRYFYLDKDMVSEEGDTPLLRLLALHACPLTIANFLFSAKSLIHSKPQGELLRLEGQREDGQLYNDMRILKEVILQSNYQGVSPLHVALHRNSWYVRDIVQLLLTLDPSLVRRRMSITGSYPLHISMANNLTIQSAVLEDLLDADPSIVCEEDFNGDNPVSLLYKNVLRFRWARDWETQDLPPEFISGDSSWMTVITPEQFREMSLSMISAARGEMGDANGLSWRDITAFPRCPPLLIRLLGLKAKRESLLEADGHGRVALHYAAMSPAMTTEALEEAVIKDFVSTLELVISMEPDAASVVDFEGNYPLHYALENLTLSCQVIEDLIIVTPGEALLTTNSVSGLVPFQQAAARRDTQNVSTHYEELSLVYAILRAEPSSILS